MQYINITKKDNYVILQMQRGKVNAINHDMVEEIRQAFRDFSTDEQIGGVIITGIPRIFSAGLDLIELYDYDEKKMTEFFISFGSMHIELATFKKPLIAAINGHSPAGGTVIALAADYRIMAEGERYTMGLNEVAVNIQVTHNLIEAYAFWIGRGNAHRYILEGKLLNCQESLACGLVQELCSDEDLMEKAEDKMKHYLMANPTILLNTKAKLRKSWWDNLSTDATEDLRISNDIWWSQEVRSKMGMYVDHLKNKNR